jgi:hypothetical protein
MRLLTRLAEAMFDFLNVGRPLQPGDAIFVLAGKQERKLFGIELWKRALAPELILSVGRFEWRRFYRLGFASDGGLGELVERTPPKKRHFFLRCVSSNVSALLTRKGYFGTWSEGRELARILRDSQHRSIILVSTSFHLRRVVLVMRRAFRSGRIDLRCVAVPEDMAHVQRAQLQSSWWARWEVLREFAKYLFYLVVCH